MSGEYNPETNRYEQTENCHACGHLVHAEYDEDGTPVVYRPVEPLGEAVDTWLGFIPEGTEWPDEKHLRAAWSVMCSQFRAIRNGQKS